MRDDSTHLMQVTEEFESVSSFHLYSHCIMEKFGFDLFSDQCFFEKSKFQEKYILNTLGSSSVLLTMVKINVIGWLRESVFL